MPRAPLRRLFLPAAALALAAPLLIATARPALPDEPPADPYQAALDRALGVEEQLVDTLAKVRPASVSVLIMKKMDPRPGSQDVKPMLVPAGCGSGVIVTFSGKTWIITNDHVAGDADALEIMTHDGKTYPAELVDRIRIDDVALLRFTGKTTGLKGVPISAKASKDLVEGQWVLATGNPFELGSDGRSVSTLGVISGLGRILGTREHVYADAIQHDAAVNPGNSGGPLWNLKGELVGINGMIASRGGGGTGASNTGASFAIPIDHIQPYLAKLANAKADAQAGFLGIVAETATDAKGSPTGARIQWIDPRSPARGGQGSSLAEGDVIVSVSIGAAAAVKILTTSDFMNSLSGCPAGCTVRVSYKRNGKSGSWSGKLGAQQ